MSMRVLVTYASVSGSTAEVAEAIGEVLEGQDLKVWVQPMKSVSEIETYDAIIAGSSIRAGRWLPEAIKFLDNFQLILNRKVVAYFTTCLTMVHDDEDSRRTVMAYMEPILQKTPDVKPVGLGMFAGSLDPHRQQMMHIQGPQGDYRNWNAIRTWAREIGPRLIERVEVAGEATKPEYTIILRNAVLAYTDMSKTNLSGVDLSGADMYEADLSDSDLREATLNWAEMNWATMSHADFSRANLIGADLEKATIDGANFSHAILNGADLSHADLSGANLSGADLNWVDLRGANLSNANLTDAKLGWANLQGADLSDVTLDRATYNTATQWPDDFSAEDYNGILVDIGPR